MNLKASLSGTRFCLLRSEHPVTRVVFLLPRGRMAATGRTQRRRAGWALMALLLADLLALSGVYPAAGWKEE